MNPQTEQDRVDRMRRVKVLMADPTLLEMRDHLKAQYHAQFEQSKTSQERDELHAQLKALNDLFGVMNTAVGEGTFAERKLQKAEETKAPTRRT